jgi:hypothetical protein
VALAKRPLHYWRFISRLKTLEVGIPFIPPDPGSTFMVFRWGGDGMYGGVPGGPHHILVHHELNFVMPVCEIDNCLKRLEPDGSLVSQFWQIEDHGIPSNTSGNTPSPSGSPKSPSK